MISKLKRKASILSIFFYTDIFLPINHIIFVSAEKDVPELLQGILATKLEVVSIKKKKIT